MQLQTSSESCFWDWRPQCAWCKRKKWSFIILLVVSQRCCNGRCLGAVFSDLLYSRVRTVMRIEKEDTGYNEKGNFRVSSVYHLSQCRKWQPGPIVSTPLWHAPEYGPCQFVQTSSYLKYLINHLLQCNQKHIADIPTCLLRLLDHPCIHLSIEHWISGTLFAWVYEVAVQSDRV